MAKNPFHQLNVIREASRKGYIITDCYRLMYHKALWLKVHENLYGIKESSKRFDFPYMLKIDGLIEKLKAGIFRFSAVNNCVKLKVNKKTAVLNEVMWENELVGEGIRIILTNVYDPLFSEHAHGSRSGSGRHTALSSIKNNWKELNWCLKGEITALHDHLTPAKVVQSIAKKINDRRFLLLIHNAVANGVLKQSKAPANFGRSIYNKKLYLLLTDIFLRQFDCFIENQFLKREMKQSNNALEMEYVRYHNHFVIGIAAHKYFSKNTSETIHHYLEKKLCIPANLQIIHFDKSIPFLGFHLRREQNKGQMKKQHPIKKKNTTQSIRLEIPQKKLQEAANKHNYGDLMRYKCTHRPNLINKSEVTILRMYNKELYEIAAYYRLADNFHQLDGFFYFAQCSFIKTLAHKRRTTFRKVILSTKRHRQGAICIVSKDKAGNKLTHSFIKRNKLSFE
ncbi:group II intron reverse transcriptase/maturase [Virgibacillus sp. MG-45]|uniref:group II intron reverse transcriptase/maturase n=1 Tax=Virgibacillus sp. MG-45 TaxID=3102791 RepID=UPI002ED9F039